MSISKHFFKNQFLNIHSGGQSAVGGPAVEKAITHSQEALLTALRTGQEKDRAEKTQIGRRSCGNCGIKSRQSNKCGGRSVFIGSEAKKVLQEIKTSVLRAEVSNELSTQRW